MSILQDEYGQSPRAPRSFDESGELLEQLKQKYAPALQLLEQDSTAITRILRVQEGKLQLVATVPSPELRERVLEKVRQIDPEHRDWEASFITDPDQQDAGRIPPGGTTYTTQEGDTLPALAERFYGDRSAYPEIFSANRDQLSDPDLVEPGLTLTIPPQQGQPYPQR